jgi:hypothetical protein
MPLWIYDYPTWALVVGFALAFLGVAYLGMWLVRPHLLRFLRTGAPADMDVGVFLEAHGVIYGILLGLIAAGAYNDFDQVSANVNAEAAALGALYRDVSTLPDPIRTTLRTQLEEYTDYVIDEAWPQQRRGVVRPDGTRMLDRFFGTLAGFEPATPTQEILFAEAFGQANEYAELRRLRLQDVDSGIHGIVWFVVFLGAAISIVLVWGVDMSPRAQFLLGGVTALFLGSVICLIAAMDHPFRGDFSVGPDAFESVRSQVMAIESAVRAGAAR